LASDVRETYVRAPVRGAAALALLATIAAFVVLGCGSSGNTAGGLVPVSGTDTMGTMGLTSSTGTGTASVHGRITYNGAMPTGSVRVVLKDAAGNDVSETYAQGEFTIAGLMPGSYRLVVYTLQTGYIAQWYGGLPVQTHAAADSQILQVDSGRTEVEMSLQPGRSIQGRVTWSGADRAAGWVWAYDASGHDTFHSAGLYPPDQVYLIVGLVPGQYKIGATVDDAQDGPQVWYGNVRSLEKARLVDVTQGDATGIDIDLGELPPTTVPIAPTTTIPQTTALETAEAGWGETVTGTVPFQLSALAASQPYILMFDTVPSSEDEQPVLSAEWR
jgi:hypothetical protein